MTTRTKERRTKETYDAALEIHGGTEENSRPAAYGLVETLLSKFSNGIAASTICKKPKLAKNIAAKVHKDACITYENSTDNMLRSVAVYYTMGVMGKRKYIRVRRALSFKNASASKVTKLKIAKCSVASLVPYYKLVKYLNGLDIGNLYSVEEELCQNVNDTDNISGLFRDIKEFLPKLAEFYLKMYKSEDFNWFGQPYNFKVAIGGDGAPFGKHDQSCAWLISFLNIDKRFLSSEDNFLIFGANCPETCDAVKAYVCKLLTDIQYMETNVFKVNDINVKFTFSELPNDMKMLCFLAGEPSNSATYFSTFGTVSVADMANLNFSFGQAKNCQWKPWNYDKRLLVVKRVETLKKKLEKAKGSEKTKRAKITSLIAQNQSRQEFVPRIGRFIDRAHVEPLHLKNNLCALMHRKILEYAIGVSKLPQNVNVFKDVVPESPFARLIDSLKTKANLSRLSKKIIRWFDETKGNGKTFEYRFTGHESRMFLHNFMYLIQAISNKSDSESHKFKLHVFAFACLKLRDAVALFNRFEIKLTDLAELDKACADFYYCIAVFLKVNPSVWTLGHVVPVHTREMFAKYGKGLALNSMEGREAKHQAISRYAKNSNYNTRWLQIFRHEFVSLIWLREKGYNLSYTNRRKHTYIPKRIHEEGFCYCGLPKRDVCDYCSHEYRSQIEKSVSLKSVQVDKSLLLNLKH
jgi:hypothetical protein